MRANEERRVRKALADPHRLRVLIAPTRLDISLQAGQEQMLRDEAKRRVERRQTLLVSIWTPKFFRGQPVYILQKEYRPGPLDGDSFDAIANGDWRVNIKLMSAAIEAAPNPRGRLGVEGKFAEPLLDALEMHCCGSALT